jgi:hypothetical protein
VTFDSIRGMAERALEFETSRELSIFLRQKMHADGPSE